MTDSTATGPGPVFAPGTFRPDPRPSGRWHMLRAAAGLELKMLIRNGEQLLLAVVIPLGALVGLTTTTVINLTAPRVNTVTPGVLALAIMSTAFTSQAITTAFDRRYGVLKRLAAAGMGKTLLVAGKCGAALVVIVAQWALLGAVAFGLGWHPRGNAAWVPVLVVLGAAAFIGLALLLGGTLRAEAVLALANVVWLALVVVGGVVIPLTKAPDWLRIVGELTPAGALSTALRAVLQYGTAPTAASLAALLVWIAVGWGGTVRWFRWQ
ncbi:ABC-2 type transport system permease protein [Nakamurella panacisegetis]|uniref:ABC-2 type transport system permease protein n=1 Tax=Nakamurella panacisegetis TaxID=1090615 RepID=A0A1H0SI32_9ACTN|nr:ABC transporter permease [Nakamurella panacisegetis]SDP40888.1 ABC-2 type transport system permease protein [Nakamurella panacisegetis]